MTTTVTIVIETKLDGSATITVTTVADDGDTVHAENLNLTAGTPVPKEK